MHLSETINRRSFIKRASATFAATAVPGLSFASQASDSSQYKALVCVYLSGGNDAWNTITPTSDPEYRAYAQSRGFGETWGLAIDKGSLLAIDKGDSIVAEGRYGMHPNLSQCHKLYQDGDLAVVSGVGPLVKPTTVDQYRSALSTNNKSHPLPSGLFGHNTQVNQWNCLNGTVSRPYGWAGRALDALYPLTQGQKLPVAMSTSGQSQFLTGVRNIPFGVDPNGLQEFEGLTRGRFHSERAAAYRRLMSSTLSTNAKTIYHKGFAEMQLRALENAREIRKVIESAPNFNYLHDGTTLNRGQELASQLSTVAKLISARDTYECKRQVFMVIANGYDTHDNQMSTQPTVLATLDRALDGFARALKSMGVWDDVVTFTQSDFGRTLTSNGDGSDHGWSGLQLVLGGAVNGGRMVGSYPTLELGGPGEVGKGNFIPDVSADQYAATLATWFGVSDRDLDVVCPHLKNFSKRDIGVFSASVDTDGDGVRDEIDTDDDNDGVSDVDDAFPLDSSETMDTDKDGVGNNADTDDDGDGYDDVEELDYGSNPLDLEETPDLGGLPLPIIADVLGLGR